MSKEELENGCAGSCGSCGGCGHDHGDDMLKEGISPIITLTDEAGEDVKFEVLDVVVTEDEKEYLIVAEAEKEESEDVEVVILEIKQEGEEEVYDTVTDEEVAQKVFDLFMEQQEGSDEE